MAIAITEIALATVIAETFSATTAQLAAQLTALTAIQELGYKITATVRVPTTVIRLRLATTVIVIATVTVTVTVAVKEVKAVDIFLNKTGKPYDF